MTASSVSSERRGGMARPQSARPLAPRPPLPAPPSAAAVAARRPKSASTTAVSGVCTLSTLSESTVPAAQAPPRPPSAPRPRGAPRPAAPTDGFADAPALLKLRDVLRTQIAVLRGVFRELDPQRSGHAPLQALRRAIACALYLSDGSASTATTTTTASAGDDTAKIRRLLAALDELLRLADPEGTGTVEFGRLTRLVRAPSLEIFQHTTASTSAAAGAIDEVEDRELRARFSAVHFTRRVHCRLRNPARLAKIPIGLRPSGVLGDAAPCAAGEGVPWAVMGDDTKIDHILSSIEKERARRLRDMLDGAAGHAAAATTPSGGSGSSGCPTTAAAAKCHSPSTRPGRRLNLRQLTEVLRCFDPSIHDAEVQQYFHASPAAGGFARQGTAAAQKLIDSRVFFTTFGKHILTPPGMRCSADFRLSWSLAHPRVMARPTTGSRIVQRAIEARKAAARRATRRGGGGDAHVVVGRPLPRGNRILAGQESSNERGSHPIAVI